MEYICDICASQFSTKYNLTRHTQAQICQPSQCYKCSYCDRDSTTSRGIKIHEHRCKKRIKYERDMAELKRQLEASKTKNKSFKNEISDLKIQLAEKRGMLAVKAAPKTVNNNNYVSQKLLSIQCSTIDPFTVETVKKSVDGGKYTFQHFKLGPSGIVDFIADIICTEDGQRNYACSDVSRNKCHRLIETREWSSDNGATFINKILDELRDLVVKYNNKVINMWSLPDERDMGDDIREKTRDMVTGVIDPKTVERKELFTKVRAGVKRLAAV